jgi:type II secretory pathway pseudopilin PulG
MRCVSRAGFTLMDILVSIAVIAILIGMLLPKLSQVQETARRVVCQSNVRQIGIGIMSYANEHQGWLPSSVFLPDGPGRGSMEPQNMNTLRLTDGRWDGMGNLISGEYLSASKVFYCPSHRGEKPYSKYATLFTHSPGEILGNYHYRGEGPSGHGPNGPTTRNLDKIDPAFSSLISDSLQLQSDYNHVVGANFFRADLSVHWFSDPGSRLRMLLPATKSEADNSFGYVPELWNRFDESANNEAIGVEPNP